MSGIKDIYDSAVNYLKCNYKDSCHVESDDCYTSATINTKHNEYTIMYAAWKGTEYVSVIDASCSYEKTFANSNWYKDGKISNDEVAKLCEAIVVYLKRHLYDETTIPLAHKNACRSGNRGISNALSFQLLSALSDSNMSANSIDLADSTENNLFEISVTDLFTMIHILNVLRGSKDFDNPVKRHWISSHIKNLEEEITSRANQEV